MTLLLIVLISVLHLIAAGFAGRLIATDWATTNRQKIKKEKDRFQYISYTPMILNPDGDGAYVIAGASFLMGLAWPLYLILFIIHTTMMGGYKKAKRKEEDRRALIASYRDSYREALRNLNATDDPAKQANAQFLVSTYRQLLETMGEKLTQEPRTIYLRGKTYREVGDRVWKVDD